MTIIIKSYDEVWTLNRDANTAVCLEPSRDRTTAMSYDDGLKLIRLAHILGQKIEVGE